MVHTCWLYYFSKFIELLDTVSMCVAHTFNCLMSHGSNKLLMPLSHAFDSLSSPG